MSPETLQARAPVMAMRRHRDDCVCTDGPPRRPERKLCSTAVVEFVGTTTLPVATGGCMTDRERAFWRQIAELADAFFDQADNSQEAP